MTIKIGDRLPNATVKQITPDGFKDVQISDLTYGKTVALFAIPGAFTPTCTNVHLPGFNAKMNQFKSKGVDVICLSVNDPFVMAAWGKANQSHPELNLLADWNADFTKAIGLSFDASGAALGTRSKRYSMLVKDGVVQQLFVQETPSQCDVSSADHLLEAL